MGLSNINLKWFIGILVFVLFLKVLNLDTLLLTVVFGSVIIAMYVLIAFIALGILYIIYSISKAALLWNIWKKVSYPVPSEFLEAKTEQKVIEKPSEDLLLSSLSIEGIENAIIGGVSIYLGFVFVLRNADLGTLLGGSPVTLGLSVFMLALYSILFYVLVLRIAWFILRFPIMYLYSKSTGKRVVDYTPDEIRQQMEEVEEYYKRTVKILGKNFSEYRNKAMKEGMLASVKDSDLRFIFDYNVAAVQKKERRKLPGRKRREKVEVTEYVPAFRITAFLPNRTGKVGAIGWPFGMSTDALREGDRSDVHCTPALESEFVKVFPVLQKFARSKVRLEQRETTDGWPLAMVFQKKGILILIALKKDFKDEELQKTYDAIAEINRVLA